MQPFHQERCITHCSVSVRLSVFLYVLLSVCVRPSVCLTCTTSITRKQQDFESLNLVHSLALVNVTFAAISRSKGRMPEFPCALKLQLKHRRLQCVMKLRWCSMADIWVSVFVWFFLNVIFHIYWCDKNLIDKWCVTERLINISVWGNIKLGAAQILPGNFRPVY